MNVEHIDGIDLARMLKAGCIKVEEKKDQVNALNVFPVPDGDTGTNMYLTLMAAAREIDKQLSPSIGRAAAAISRGSLMGARGNSGVILSQVFRGIAKRLEGMERAAARDLGEALQLGADTAYRAVMKPVEGTILTVIREVARAAVAEARENPDIVAALLAAVDHGNQVLARTPQMLPALQEAGVVDAGGQGLLYFIEGALEALALDKDISLVRDEKPRPGPRGRQADIILDFQYCTEVLVTGNELDTEAITNQLAGWGDSLLVVGDSEMVKVHVHSNHPGQVLENCLQFGSLHDIKINNMVEESRQREESLQHLLTSEAGIGESNQHLGVVAVAVGSGIGRIFESLGVNQLVDGGQTMNPSTEDIAAACQSVKADNIIVLPNNSNIVMAAQQAKQLCDQVVEVIPTRGIMQGIAAMVAYDSGGELDEVISAMVEQMEHVKSAEVTYAVRDSVVNGLQIEEGNILGIVDGEVEIVTDSVNDTVIQLLEELIGEEDELVTLIYGEEVDKEDAERLRAILEELYPTVDIEMHFGGQSHYYYFLSVE